MSELHDRHRRGGRHARAAGQPDLPPGSGLLRGRRRRPALRPAQPLRPAADDRGAPSPHLLGIGHRRGHRRRGHRRPRRSRCVGTGAVFVVDARGGRDRRARGRAATPRCWSPAPCVHSLPAGATFDLRTATPDRRSSSGTPTPLGSRPRPGRTRQDASRSATAGPRAAHRGEAPMAAHSRPRPAPPRPTSRILETRVYRGPNIWSYEPAIHLVVDLGALEEYPTNTLPGLHRPAARAAARAARATPAPAGRRGGFVERLHEGTWLGHVAEHVALRCSRTAGHDIRRGKTRQVKGEPRPLQRHLRLRRRAGRPRGRPARRAPGQPPGPGRPGASTSTAELERFLRRAERTAFGPSTAGDPRRGGQPRHPVDPAQPALAGPARPGRPPASGSGPR